MFTVRTATAADAETLAELGLRTFRETFEAHNTPEDMALYLAEHFGAPSSRSPGCASSSFSRRRVPPGT